MKNNVVKFALLGIGLLLFAFLIFKFQPNQKKYTQITVVGEAQAKNSPDTAVITFAVVNQAKDALAAQQENAKRIQAVKSSVEVIASNAQAEVETNDYSLSPEYDYSGRMAKISGYEVRNTLTISIKDLSQVGTVIDAATKAGANNVERVNFIIDKNSSAQGESLTQATAEAMKKAEVIAKSLNGKIIRVSEARENGIPALPFVSESRSMSNSALSVAKPAYRTEVEAGLIESFSKIVLVVEIEIANK